MANVTVTPADVSASQTEGAIINIYKVAAGQTINVGDAVAKDGGTNTVDGLPTVVQADGNNADWASSRAFGIAVNTTDWYGSTAVAAGNNISVCEFGPVHGFSSLVPGTVLFTSDTAGAISDSVSTTHPWVIGMAQAADTVFVNPHGTGSTNY